MKYTFCTNYFRRFPANRLSFSQDSLHLPSPVFLLFLILGEKPHLIPLFRRFFRISFPSPMRFFALFGVFPIRRFAQSHFFISQMPLSFLS